MTHLIVAIDRKGAIGHAGDQLYYIKEDLKRFKSLTMGNTIIMGRKTFEALPKGALPGRKNIVVTRNRSYRAPGAEVAHSLAEALSIAPAEAFIIGGAEIYRQALPMADTLRPPMPTLFSLPFLSSASVSLPSQALKRLRRLNFIHYQPCTKPATNRLQMCYITIACNTFVTISQQNPFHTTHYITTH